MRSEEWDVIQRLYYDALRLAAEEREGFLAEACAGDDSLRKKVESLLAFSESSDGFLEEPAFGVGMKLLANEEQGESLIGRQIGPYTVLSEIGRGGMGTVYLAKDQELDRDVALKALSPSWAQDSVRVERFRQEARLAAITHPNIAHVYRPVEDEGRYFFVMEFVHGTTLRQLLNEGGLEVRKAVDIAAQVAAGLAAAHARGVVHRDIKPENIMVCEDGTVKVLDFGLAKLVSGTVRPAARPADTVPLAHETAVAQTDFGILLGTAEYMSPEQVLNAPVDQRTDVWSLGVVLYEMVCGRLPFKGANTFGSIAEILKTELPPRIPGMPGGLEKIVRKALAKDAAERYQQVKDMQADLQQVLKELPAGLPDGAGVRSNRWAIFVIALCVAVAAVALILSAVKRERGDRPAPVTQKPPPQPQGDAPNRVIDLSDTYGRVHMTVFNKKTRVVFATPYEFFQDSGVTSFDIPIKFEEFSQLPPDLRRWDGKQVSPEAKKAIETQP